MDMQEDKLRQDHRQQTHEMVPLLWYGVLQQQDCITHGHPPVALNRGWVHLHCMSW